MTSPEPLRTMTAAQRRANAAWLRDQYAELERWLTENPHRWPHGRVSVAMRAIGDGDERWRLKAAEALR